MRFSQLASVLLVCLSAVGAWAARSEVDPPVRTKIDLPLKNQSIDGMVTAWDERSVWIAPRGAPDGSQAVEIPWNEVDADQTFKLWLRVMDKKWCGAWEHLGIAMLDVADIERADRAFAQAVRLDPSSKSVIAKIKEVHGAGGDAHALVPAPEAKAPEKPEPAPGDGPKEGGGEGSGATDKPEPKSDVPPDQETFQWVPENELGRANTVKKLKTRAQEMIQASGLKNFQTVETDYFLFYSNLAPSEIRRWSDVLDKMYATLMTTLEIPKETYMFHGKCVVFICNARHEFLAFEQAAFNFDATRAGGVCHTKGAETWVSFYRGEDDARFQSVLVHETTHAFMHRYKSPARLPTWANEGLADYVAGVLTPMSQEPREHWTHVKQFAQAGKDPMVIMKQSYRDGTWYTEDSYPVSHMLVRYLLKYKPRAFKEWIDDIKIGVAPDSSMRTRFGVTSEEVAKGFIAETMSERFYQPNSK